MLTRLLALLAVVALLAAPVNAAAAQAGCDQMTMVVDAAMAAMPGMADDPCCDHDKAPPKSADRCLHACLTMSGTPATVPTASAPVPAAWTWLAVERVEWLRPASHAPPLAERPPRSIA
jgi:hypothetical protein